MSPAEKVLAWLGSAGAPVLLCSGPDYVEGESEDSPRFVKIYVADSRAHTQHFDASGRDIHADWTVDGEPGVRYLARWLVDGGRIESPHLRGAE